MSLQEKFAPKSICFGCGPANEKGLKIRSFEIGNQIVAKFRASPEHQAFVGVVNGGIIGALLDCHCNWAAAYHLFQKTPEQEFPSTVTAEYTIKLMRPTPLKSELQLIAQVVESTDDRAVVEGQLIAEGKITATCRGVFVSVKPGHPAYHRW